MNNIKLMLGDSSELIKEIQDNSIDLIIMDPPYKLNLKGGKKNMSTLAQNLRSLESELTKVNLTNGYNLEILNELIRIQKNINIYIWCSINQIKDYLDFFIGTHNCSFEMIIWNKTNPVPLFNHKYMGDKEYCLYFKKRGYCNPPTYHQARTVYYLPINQKEKKLYHHPTIKPLCIIENLVLNSSRSGDTILDCFMGSGTTGVAVMNANENRRFIGMEISKEYFNIATQRINEAINNKVGEKNG